MMYFVVLFLFLHFFGIEANLAWMKNITFNNVFIVISFLSFPELVLP